MMISCYVNQLMLALLYARDFTEISFNSSRWMAACLAEVQTVETRMKYALFAHTKRATTNKLNQ